MKVLIWIGCLLGACTIKALLFGNASIGAIPATIGFGLMILIATILCRLWDKRQLVKKNSNIKAVACDNSKPVVTVPSGNNNPDDLPVAYCRRCGVKLLEKSCYCRHCGTKIAQEEDKKIINDTDYKSNKRFCRYCGTSLFSEEVFCRHCGRKIATEQNQYVEKTSASSVAAADSAAQHNNTILAVENDDIELSEEDEYQEFLKRYRKD